MTLSNVDALGATTEGTIESAIDTLANLTSSDVYNSGCFFALLMINFAAFLSFNLILNGFTK